VHYVYSIEFSAQAQERKKEPLSTLPKSLVPQSPVLVVGTGPSGLFCALRLLDRGIKPLVIERGESVDERVKATDLFFYTGFLNPESNVQFGEGGAGTFSDGKLNTGTHSPLIGEVLSTFVRFGAPEEIEWLSKPHIGSDSLKTVVKNMRQYIIDQGGQVLFHTRLEDISIKNGQVEEAIIRKLNADMVPVNGDFGVEKLPVSAIVLAIGHSARDTFETLLKRGVPMRQKDFAVGVRIEHLQSAIGFAQYGQAYTKLPSADYKLVSHASDRACFTFCMCPGGFVMPAASEEGGVVTNGMSNFARNGLNANSALIAQVSRADFDDDSPLAGVR
jgi:uncharacterized FAD-dependent dehydrogenase